MFSCFVILWSSSGSSSSLCCFPSDQQRLKPANGSRSTFLDSFLVLLDSKSFLNANFFSVQITILAATVFFFLFSRYFFLLNEIFVIIFDFVALFSYLFLSLSKKSYFSSKFDSIYLAQFLQMFSFEKGLWTSLYYLVYIVCYFATKHKENT